MADEGRRKFGRHASITGAAALSASAALFFSMAAVASVSIVTPKVGGENKLMIVFLTESITKGDAAVVVRKASEMQNRSGKGLRILAKLDSSGGSIEAALQIGRLLRRVGAMAVVEKDAVCMSSCVYVLAGAANRAVDGRVGIHRPYEPEGKELAESAQKAKYKKLGAEIKAYLEGMNIPARLYDDSLFISPENVRILTPNELQAYGLSENDPFADEANATKQAQNLGISRKEYAARKVRARRECQWDGNDSRDSVVHLLECRAGIVNGVR